MRRWPAYWLRGSGEQAEALAREAAVCKHAVDDRNGLTMVLETLAWMAAERGGYERAGLLLGCAQRVCDASSLTLIELYREQHERSVSIVNILNKLGLSSRIQISRWMAESAPAAATSPGPA